MKKIGIHGFYAVRALFTEGILKRENFEFFGCNDTSFDLHDIIQFGSLDYLTDFSSVINRCDYIILGDEHQSPYEFTRQALRKGKPVILLHPFLLNYDESKNLSKLSEEAGIEVYCFHADRFHPVFQTGQKQLENKVLLLRFEHRVPFLSESNLKPVMEGTLVQDLDLILDSSKAVIRKISVSAQKIISKVPDSVSIYIEFDTGLSGELWLNRMAIEPNRKMTLLEKNLLIEMDFIHSTVKTIEKEKSKNAGPNALFQEFAELPVTKLIIGQPALSGISPLVLFFDSVFLPPKSQTTKIPLIHETYSAMKLARHVIDKINKGM